MTIDGVKITFWAARGLLGGLCQTPYPADACAAIVDLAGEAISFNFPADRRAFDSLLLGLEFGNKAGRIAKAKEVRDVLYPADESAVSR